MTDCIFCRFLAVPALSLIGLAKKLTTCFCQTLRSSLVNSTPALPSLVRLSLSTWEDPAQPPHHRHDKGPAKWWKSDFQPGGKPTQTCTETT